jgi:hypothetical protein
VCSLDQPLDRVCAILHAYARPWWIAGGWALDLHIDEARAHGDVDIAVLRRDQHELQRYLSGWSLNKMVSGSPLSWAPREDLQLPVHEIHAEKDGEHLEFLLNEAVGDDWHFRRNDKVSMPLARLSRRSSSGIPYLCPEVVLLYKAKSLRRIDRSDFDRTHALLEDAERLWLARALEICHPGHEWLSRLNSP